MKRGVPTLVAIGAALVLSACTGEVVVQASLEGADGTPIPLANLPIRALPYDRDVIFDSLAAAYPEPEPAIPDSLLQLQDSIAEAQQAYSTAESRWATARDSLQVLSTALSRLSRGSPQYRIMFTDFGAQEDVERTTERQKNTAFDRYTRLQNRFASQANELRLLRERWGDEAYAGIDTVIALRLDASGREERADTTSGNGVARFAGLKPGQWWIHAFYSLPFEDLYWNVPVEVPRGGDPVVVQLNRETAQTRPKL
jgi:hypothetical protein